MSNIDATRVMGAPGSTLQGGNATIQMPVGGDVFRTQMGGVTTCPICKSSTPLLDPYCGDCGYFITQPSVSSLETDLSAGIDDKPAAELVDEAGRRYRLQLGANTIGRQGADVLTSEGTVSRVHACVTVTAAGVTVEDLGSSNGTKVGDLRLKSNDATPAPNGAVLKFGSWRVTLEIASDESPADATIMVAPVDQTIAIAKPAAVEAETVASPITAPEPAVDDLDEPAAKALKSVAILKKVEGISDSIEIAPGLITLGRRAGNSLVLADPYLSGKHAEIRAEGGAVTLTDLGSTNGTFVNGQRLAANEKQALEEGDEIQLGQTRYLFSGAPPDQAAAGAADAAVDSPLRPLESPVDSEEFGQE